MAGPQSINEINNIINNNSNNTIMKTKYFILAATAITMMVSCADEKFVGDENLLGAGNGEGAISFGSGFKAITRADHVGADAADLLGEKFYVGGYKNNGTSYTTVFDNYLVQWYVNTAGTTQDNTSDWKYVGLTNPGFADHISGAQTIKYWDYSASFYDYVAYSPGKGNTLLVAESEGHPTTNEILATAIAPTTLTTAAYTLKGSATDLSECYIADLITAKESGAASPDINYNDEVSIKFRRLGSKVRVALYEAIPGYSVRDVRFYQDAATAAGTDISSNTSATLFASSNVFYPNGVMTIKFPTIGTSNRSKTDYNKAHVTFAGAGDAVATQALGAIQYETTPGNWEDSRLNYTGNENTYLKRTSTNPSFAGVAGDNYYTTVLPNETGNVLELRVDYVLESIDGTKETIKVYGATAFVPQIYAAWKPNYAYTYIFKISDNTDGWTKVGAAVQGIYPITFDAVVADSEDGTQSTITTVATPSITTYMKGHKYDTDGPEYKAGSDSIYVRVMDGSTIKNDLNTKGKLYTVTGATVATATEADVMDALNIQASETSGTIVGRNGLTLTPATEQVATGNATFGTIPGPDGNNIPDIAANTATRFLATAATYAYVYDTGTDNADSEIHSAVVFTASSQPADQDAWDDIKASYYSDEACTEAAPSTWTTLTGEDKVTYYQKYTNLNKVYSVKVIRVVAAP